MGIGIVLGVALIVIGAVRLAAVSRVEVAEVVEKKRRLVP